MTTAHEHDRQDVPPAERAAALERLLMEKGIVDGKLIDAIVDRFTEKVGPRKGARLVARAWLDPGFKQRLLA